MSSEQHPDTPYDWAWLRRFAEASGTHSISAFEANGIARYVRQLQLEANAIVQLLEQVGNRTNWKHGNETDRVYSWHEIDQLRRALHNRSF